MKKFNPLKTTSTRNNLPWIHTKRRQMIKKKQKMYNKTKMSKKEKVWEQYNIHKINSLRSARLNCINKIFLTGLNENNIKPFCKYLKSTRQYTKQRNSPTPKRC